MRIDVKQNYLTKAQQRFFKFNSEIKDYEKTKEKRTFTS